jgi:hypothetical protein
VDAFSLLCYVIFKRILKLSKYFFENNTVLHCITISQKYNITKIKVTGNHESKLMPDFKWNISFIEHTKILRNKKKGN